MLIPAQRFATLDNISHLIRNVSKDPECMTVVDPFRYELKMPKEQRAGGKWRLKSDKSKQASFIIIGVMSNDSLTGYYGDQQFNMTKEREPPTPSEKRTIVRKMRHKLALDFPLDIEDDLDDDIQQLIKHQLESLDALERIAQGDPLEAVRRRKPRKDPDYKVNSWLKTSKTQDKSLTMWIATPKLWIEAPKESKQQILYGSNKSIKKPPTFETPSILRDLPYRDEIQSMGLILNPDVEIYDFQNHVMSPMHAYKIPVGTWMLIQCTPVLWDINPKPKRDSQSRTDIPFESNRSRTYQLIANRIELALAPQSENDHEPTSPSTVTSEPSSSTASKRPFEQDPEPSPPLEPAPKRSLVTNSLFSAPKNDDEMDIVPKPPVPTKDPKTPRRTKT